MRPNLVWTPLAREDLLDIYLRIATYNEPAADRLYGRIEERVLELTDHPRMGPRRPEFGRRIRMLVVRPYAVFYEVSPDDDRETALEIKILRVLHGRRNLSDLL